METEKYKVLLTSIEMGSFATAAEKLGYTTSGISRMMASLEEEMGLQLLVRSKGGVHPTSACEKILPEIETMLHSVDLLQRKSASLQGVISGTVRIGTAYNYYYDAIAEAVRSLKKQYPSVSVEITSSYSSDLAEQINAHKLDLCIMSRREHRGDWIPLVSDEMMAAVSAKNSLAGQKTISMSKFAAEPYIQTHPEVDSDSARIFQKCGVIPNTRYTTEDSMATFSMVAAGLGITMNNGLNCRMWRGRDIKVLSLRPKQKIEIGIAVSEEADEATQCCLEELRSSIRSMQANVGD